MKNMSINEMREVNGGAALRCSVCRKIFYTTWSIGWHDLFGCSNNYWIKVY